MVECVACNGQRAVIRRPKNNSPYCKSCFIEVFEEEIHQTIISTNMFKSGSRVAIGASGGKDSTVLIHTLTKLNKRYGYGLELELLSIDEGITGYRDDSLATVKRNRVEYELPLHILSYSQLYGCTMDEVVQQVGLTNNCTYCGVFRRQALDRGAVHLGVDMIVTGHNADDLAETVLMNVLRGDISRLVRCVEPVTGVNGSMPRAKPFKYSYQKEIVMYAYFLKLDYFSTECTYAPQAFRGNSREFLKRMERLDNSTVLNIIKSAERFSMDKSKSSFKAQVLQECVDCGYMSSNSRCKSCVLLSSLKKTEPTVPIEFE